MSQSLYERLGKAQGIGAIVSDVVDLHLQNPTVQTRFAKADANELKRLATEFFCMGSGGPEQYSGKDMRSAHEGMNISEEEFIAVIDDIMVTLKKHEIETNTTNEVLGILYSLKDEVIRV